MGLLWVAGRLPSLNQIIAESAGASSGWSKYAQTKKRWTEQVVLMARTKDLAPIPPSYMAYLFCEPNRKVDPSNMVGGGVKVLEDALQAAGLLQNDGWTDILGYVGYWEKMAHRVGCLVYWGPSLPSKETMLVLLEQEINGNPRRQDRDGTRNRSDAGRRSDAEEASGGDAQPGGSLGGVSILGQ
jgi:hypothetical protein